MSDKSLIVHPSLELVEQWATESPIQPSDESWAYELFIVTKAVQWSADWELGECCKWLEEALHRQLAERLHAARRPKQSTLKDEASAALGRFFANAHTQASEMTRDFEIIRRAVESLPD